MNRAKGWLIAWLYGLLACASARAVDPVPIDPLPNGPVNINRFQPFSSSGVLPYGDRDKARTGWFATVDWLDWWSRAPKTVPVGDPNFGFGTTAIQGLPTSVNIFNLGNVSTSETNTIDTGFIGRTSARGWRFDIGHANEEGGFLISIFDVKPFDSQFQVENGEILFRIQPLDAVTPPPGFLRTAWIFGSVTVNDQIRTQGIELMPFIRSCQRHLGGYIDWMYGVRLFRFQEGFSVLAQDVLGWPTAIPNGNPNNTFVNTVASNNLVGPQIGFRWFRERGKIQLSAEGRAMAAWNMQEVKQFGQLDLSSITTAINGQVFSLKTTEATQVRHFNNFSPLGEVRFNGAYQLTSRLLVQAGWTGIVSTNIARPNTMVDYGIFNFGILGQHNKQEIFIQGLNFGIIYNR